MEYKILKTLNKDQMIDGIKKGTENAKQLLDSGQLLAQNGYYGSAISQTILSVEELIKSYSVFQVLMGIDEEVNINAAFKTILGSTVHQSRLILAGGISEISRKMNTEALLKDAHAIIAQPDFLPREKFKSVDELIEHLPTVVERFTPLLNAAKVGLDESWEKEFMVKMSSAATWFANAKQLRERGTYVELQNNKWIAPQDLDKKNYLEAKSNADIIFHFIYESLSVYLQGDRIRRTMLELFIKASIENSISQSKTVNPV